MIDKVDIKELQKGICWVYIGFKCYENDILMLEYSLSTALKIIKKYEDISKLCLEKVLDELKKLAISDIKTPLDMKTEESFKAFVFGFEILNKSLDEKRKDDFFELANALIDDEIKKVPNTIIKDINLETNIKKFFDKFN